MKLYLGTSGKRKKNQKKQRKSYSSNAIEITWSYLSLKWECEREATFSSY